MPEKPISPDPMWDFEELVRALSHDLRAPLRAVQGFSRALEEDYGSHLPEEAQPLLQQIQKGGEQMAKILDGLLALSRASSSLIVRELVDISSIAGGVARDLNEQDKDRTIHWDIEPALVFHAEPRMTVVLLRNLLENAWKFTRKKAVAEIRIFSCTDSGRPCVCVQDNGVGFDPAQAERLFEPFHRQHDQGDFPGTGIGLATVHRIVKRHGGEIRADSVPGEGATFCFDLGADSSVSDAAGTK